MQWVASEKKGESVVPIYFWYFSIIGAVLIVIYSIVRRDIVFVVAQSLALIIYIRNLDLIYKKGGKSGNLAKYESKNLIKRYFVNSFLKEIEGIVKEIRAKKILDVGCGEGKVIKRVGNGKIKFVGIDISREAVEKARKENRGEKFLVGDIFEADRLVKGDFDLVMCLEVLEHLEKPKKALGVLKKIKSRWFLFSVPYEPWFSLGNLLMLKNVTRLGSDKDHKQKWGKKEFRKLVGRYFKVKEVKVVGFWIVIKAEK